MVDDTGRVLFDRNASLPRANASTTKMVTALVVRREAEMTEEVSISSGANAVGAAEVDLPPGGGYSVDELLQALLMASSNEAAVALAEHVSGSEQAFVEEMNRMAEQEGWGGTSFVTSHGLDRPGHFSTAEDLADIGDELLKDPALARIVATTSATITGNGGVTSFANRNLLLESYRGAIGIKTGFTAQAGNVLVAAAARQGRRVIVVAMGSDDSFVDSSELLDYGFAVLRRTVVIPEGERVAGLVFDHVGSSGVVAGEDVRGLLDASELEVTFVPEDDLALPIESGEGVGVLEIRNAKGKSVATVDAVAEHGVEAPDTSLLQGAITGLLRGVASLLGTG